MVAAAALRSGIDLHYESSYTDQNGKPQSWQAETKPFSRMLTLDGEEVERQFVSFEVSERENVAPNGAQTIMRLSSSATPTQSETWAEWLNVIDPRNVDQAGNRGLARYVRQIREEKVGSSYSVGGITLLFDEPGAVYENGLRINADAETDRGMAFGYDVPEIVTTRERNSYNSDRLGYYISHLLSNTTDREVISRVLDKVMGGGKGKDLRLSGFSRGESSSGYWAEVAREKWPGKMVYSSEQINKDIQGSGLGAYDRESEMQEEQARREALKLKANLRHFDEEQLIDVNAESYHSLSRMLPTAERVVDQMERRTVAISEQTKADLTRMVTQAAHVFGELYDRTSTDREHALQTSYRFTDKLQEWSNFDQNLAKEDVVGLAPVDASFHGLASDGVILNESLFLRGDRKEIAEVVLHEMNHILTGNSDYTEEFVEVMYDLAKYMLEQRGGSIPASERPNPRSYRFDDEAPSSRYDDDWGDNNEFEDDGFGNDDPFDDYDEDEYDRY